MGLLSPKCFNLHFEATLGVSFHILFIIFRLVWILYHHLDPS